MFCTPSETDCQKSFNLAQLELLVGEYLKSIFVVAMIVPLPTNDPKPDSLVSCYLSNIAGYFGIIRFRAKGVSMIEMHDHEQRLIV